VSKLLEATKLLLNNQNYNDLYELYLDLIYNAVNEIGVKLNITTLKSNEKIYDYMIIIDKFLFNNINIVLFGEHIQKVVNFHTIYDKIKNTSENLKLDQYDIKELIEEYYELKALAVPNVFQDIESYKTSKYANFQTLKACNLVFGKKNKNYDNTNIEDALYEMISNRIQNDSDKIRRDYVKGKLAFDKSFRKLATLDSIQKTIESSKKKFSQIEISGTLSDNLEYKIYTLRMPGYLILSFGIISAILLGFIFMEIFSVPILAVSLYPSAIFSGLICFICFYIFIKFFIRGKK